MPTDVLLLIVTAVLAVTAAVAAVVAVRAARRTSVREKAEDAPALPVVASEPHPAADLVPLDDADSRLAPRHVEGRVVVPPTDQQVVGAALSRPQVRLAILLHGLTYALRPESRDRITGLMRREYRRRRRERLAAGRRAVRTTHPAPAEEWTSQSWIGELPAGSSATRIEP